VPFLDDLVATLAASGCGTWGTEIFTSTKSEIPIVASGGVTSGASLQLIDTGGTAPDNTQNCTIRPAFLRPSAQIVARANSKKDAERLAFRAYFVLFGIRNRFIGQNWYRSVRPLQQPTDLGLDDQGGQIKYGFNVIAAYNRRES
jgi:hypothetical protein